MMKRMMNDRDKSKQELIEWFLLLGINNVSDFKFGGLEAFHYAKICEGIGNSLKSIKQNLKSEKGH